MLPKGYKLPPRFEGLVIEARKYARGGYDVRCRGTDDQSARTSVPHHPCRSTVER